MNCISRGAMAAALPAILLAGAAQAQADQAQPDQAQDTAAGAAAAQPAKPLSPVIVHGRRPTQDDFRPKLDHIMPEVAGTQITVTKKATVIKLDQQPTVIGNNQQELFNRAPGLLISEQQTASQFNLSYRGLGNPQEAEYVLLLQDGIPISTDWIGFPTAYFVPLPQSISEIQMIRAGSSLLYGPEPAPAINFVSRRPQPGDPMSGGTEQVGGSNGLYSTYNYLQGTSGAFEYLADFGYVRGDGERDNARSRLMQGDLYLGYRPDARQLFYIDLKGYQLSAGNPGKISITQFDADPNFSPTPYNHDWVDRVSGVIGYTADFTDKLRLEAKGYAVYQALDTRSAPALSATGTPPPTTTIQDEVFRSEGVDIRLRQRWGRGNAFTLGAVAHHDSAPFRQWTSTDLYADRDDRAGTVRLNQARTTDYQAIFAENVFRFGQFHIVPSVRIDHETLDINETAKPPTATRALYDVHDSRTIPSFGIGFGNDFGHMNETYFSVSSGWRPLRYFDVASPFGNLQQGHDPDPPRSLDWEAGVHGTPIKGLWYDAGLFWMEFKNRIESQAFGTTPGDTINVNTGNTRHRGFEGELSYDFLASRDGPSHLSAFANLQLLDAKFTETNLTASGVLVGNRPNFAPKVLAKAGLTWREDKKYTVSLTGVSVSSQYFQDSNLPATVAGVVTVPAKVPRYTVFDLSGDWYITPNVRILGGIYNLADERYYSRVFQNGIEPAPGRTAFVGIGLGF